MLQSAYINVHAVVTSNPEKSEMGVSRLWLCAFLFCLDNKNNLMNALLEAS